MIIANTATTACSVTPCAHIRGWLRDIGADHVVLWDGRQDRKLAVRYALDVLFDLAADDVRIEALDLQAVLFRRGVVIGGLHTPTYRNQTIRWEQIA